MLRTLAVVLALVGLSGCNFSDCSDCVDLGEGPTIDGSGTLKTDMRTVGPFTGVRLVGSTGRLVIERTGSESLTVTAEDNLVSLFTSEVKDGVLILSVAKGNRIKGKRPVYNITVRDLRELSIRGAATIEATKLDGEALALEVSGAASGSVAGRTDTVSISISGAGSLDAGELQAKRGKVVVRGAGTVTVNASDELDAEVSGAGIIWYIGSPKLNSKVSGVGSIRKK